MFLRIGTRGSKLAIRQTEIFINELKKFIDFEYEIKIIKTKGDKILDSPLHKIPGKGFFVKEIDEELRKGNIDVGVHSLKDLPWEEDDLKIAFLKRDEKCDVLLGISPEEIRMKLKSRKVFIGTSSLRRERQIKSFFGDVEVVPIRGNVDTRIKKLADLDGIVLAYAGLLRLGIDYEKKFPLDPREFPPAPGQGIIAVKSRKDDKIEKIISLVDDKKSRLEGEIEKSIVSFFGGGCNLPIGIFTSAQIGEKIEIEIVLEVFLDKKYRFEMKEIFEDENDIKDKILSCVDKWKKNLFNSL